MIQAGQIKPLMEIVDANGDYVGRVDAVVGAEVELAEEGDAVGDACHRIPLAWVDYAWGHKCKLTLTRAEARARWDGRRDA